MTSALRVPIEFVSAAPSGASSGGLRAEVGATARLGHLRLVAAADESPSLQATYIEYVNEVVVAGRQRSLPRPLKLEVEVTEEGASALSPLLGVGGAGDDVGHAVADVIDTAWRLWLEFRDEPEQRLHESALRTRALLSRIFAE